MSDPVIAVDFGGTKVAAALVSTDGELLREAQRPTLAWSGVDSRDGGGVPSDAETVAAQVDLVLADLLAGEPPRAWRVGIGSAGPLDVPAGTASPVNVPAWRGFPLVARVRATVARLSGHEPTTVRLAGDGPCIALGEQWVGAARGIDDMIGVICSTGVGSGVVVGGKVYAGETGNAAHVGHTTVQLDGPRCPCGARGCVENLASGPAMVRRARELGWVGDDAKALTQAAAAGDRLAGQAVDEGMRALGAGLAGLVTDFDIATVVVGGGVAKAGETVFAPLRRHFAEFITMPFVVGRARIIPAELPNAGLLGAAKLALD